jgi:hypothetical protein
MAEAGSGELQTLISTLQNTNTQLGHIIRAIQGASPLPPTEPVIFARAEFTPTGPLPVEPEGYVTINIPGVGERLIPYYGWPT